MEQHLTNQSSVRGRDVNANHNTYILLSYPGSYYYYYLSSLFAVHSLFRYYIHRTIIIYLIGCCGAESFSKYIRH